MGKLIASNWMTLDGYIAGSDGAMDWILGDADMGTYELGLLDEAEVMLFGGKTYREFSAFWPKIDSSSDVSAFEKDFAGKINPLKKIVFTKTLVEPLWDLTTYLDDVDPDQIRTLKRECDGNIVMYGSASIIPQLSRHRLIDEYHVLIHPIMLGSGLPYFSKLDSRIQLRCLGADSLASGVVILRFGLS